MHNYGVTGVNQDVCFYLCHVSTALLKYMTRSNKEITLEQRMVLTDIAQVWNAGYTISG